MKATFKSFVEGEKRFIVVSENHVSERGFHCTCIDTSTGAPESKIISDPSRFDLCEFELKCLGKVVWEKKLIPV
jgi:hypothetical protein